MRIRKATNLLPALLVTIIMVFATILPGASGQAWAAKYSDVETALDSYIKNELNIPRVEFTIDSAKIRLAVNIDRDDDTVIVGKIGILASAAGAAAPWTKTVEISVYSATAPLTYIRIPTAMITDYHNDKIDTQTYLASWEFAGISKNKGGGNAVGKPASPGSNNIAGLKNTFSCKNKDNDEKGCCCFTGAHTYRFAARPVKSVVARFDTGKRFNCRSTVKFDIDRGSGWQTIKSVKANSSANGSELAPNEVVVPVGGVIKGFRISDNCVCCIDSSKIRLISTGKSAITVIPGLHQLGPVADAYVYAYAYRNWNRSNRGKYGILSAGWHPTGGESRAYLKFDLSGVDPKTLRKATLRLYHYHTGGGNSVALGIHQVTQPWNEGSDTYHSGQVEKTAPASEITWVNQPSYKLVPELGFNPGTDVNKVIELDITPLVKRWLAGEPNYGLVITPQGPLQAKPAAQYGFLAREYKDVGKRPQLLISTSTSTSTVSGGVVQPPKKKNPGANSAAFGGKDFITNGFRGDIYYLAKGTSRLPDFSTMTPQGSIFTRSINIPNQSFTKGFPGVSKRFEWFGIRYSGGFRVDRPGLYKFRTVSDDGSKLWIDDKLVVNNDGLHGARSVTGEITINPGFHTIRLDYFQGPRTMIALQLFATPPGGKEALFDWAFQPSGIPPRKQAGGGGTGAASSTTSRTGLFHSGTYRVEQGRYKSTWRLRVSNGQISGTSEWSCCPGHRIDSMTGTISGNSVVIDRDCSGQGINGACRQRYTGTIKGDGITGTGSGPGLPAGSRWVLYLNNKQPRPVRTQPLSGSARNTSALDLAFWNSIVNSDNPKLFQAYLNKFPNGVFAPIAREKIKTLAGKPSGASQSRANGAALRKRAKITYAIDLDGNGTIEQVLVVPIGKKEFGSYYSLAVLDDKGGILWTGPTVLDEENPLVFGEWDFGISMPQLVTDIDLDGAVELIAPAMQSDVSPTFFRVMRWKNNAFVPVRTAMLMQQPGAREFRWLEGEQPTTGRWVSGFEKENKPGEFIVTTMEWHKGDVKLRKALLWPVSVTSYMVHRWLPK